MPFNNIRTLTLKAQPTNMFFTTVKCSAAPPSSYRTVDWRKQKTYLSIELWILYILVKFADFSKAFDTLKRVAGIFVFSAWLTWSMSCNHTIMRKTGYEGLQHGEKHQQDSSSWRRCFSCSNRRSCQCIFKHSVSFSKSQVRCKHWNYWIHFPAKTIIVAITKLVL